LIAGFFFPAAFVFGILFGLYYLFLASASSFLFNLLALRQGLSLFYSRALLLLATAFLYYCDVGNRCVFFTAVGSCVLFFLGTVGFLDFIIFIIGVYFQGAGLFRASLYPSANSYSSIFYGQEKIKQGSSRIVAYPFILFFHSSTLSFFLFLFFFFSFFLFFFESELFFNFIFSRLMSS
jgi:hypothetical protein